MTTLYKTSEKNDLFNRISSLEKMNERLEKCNVELINIPDKEYVEKVLLENKIKTEENNEKIEEYRERISKIDSGELDEELLNKENSIKEQSNIQFKKMQKKVETKNLEKKKVQKQIDTVFKAENKLRKDERFSHKEAEWALQKFNSVVVPDYIQKKLDNMPNNKGFIWSGISYYGRLPEEPNAPLVMFERRNSVLLIHEYTHEKYNLYEKVGDEPKKLLKSEQRKKIPGSKREDLEKISIKYLQ
jgi:hypothetical protein